MCVNGPWVTPLRSSAGTTGLIEESQGFRFMKGPSVCSRCDGTLQLRSPRTGTHKGRLVPHGDGGSVSAVPTSAAPGTACPPGLEFVGVPKPAFPGPRHSPRVSSSLTLAARFPHAPHSPLPWSPPPRGGLARPSGLRARPPSTGSPGAVVGGPGALGFWKGLPFPKVLNHHFQFLVSAQVRVS